MIPSIVSGMISSLMAIFFINIYFFLNKILSYRRLKQVLCFKSKRCLISGPTNFKLHEAGVIFPRTSFSFAYILNLLFPLKFEVELLPYHKISEYYYWPSEICIGGPSSNNRTKKYLNKYLPNFSHGIITDADQIINIFKIGKDEFSDNPETETSFLVKICIDEKRTTHLFFGSTDEGTVASVHYFCENYKRIYKEFKKGSYCLALTTEKEFGYKYASFYKNYSDEIVTI